MKAPISWSGLIAVYSLLMDVISRQRASISLGLIVRMDFVIESDLAALLSRLWARSWCCCCLIWLLVELGCGLGAGAVAV